MNQKISLFVLLYSIQLNYIYIFLGIAAITTLLFLSLFFYFRLKITLQQQQLLQEKQVRLQKDLLSVTLQIEQKDEILLAVQKKIEETKEESPLLKQINQIIDQGKRIDNIMGANKTDFNHIHPEFFEKLKEKSDNTLSRLDLKYCSYISIGLTNKEIAQRLGIAPKSILMARYRIKLKLGLGKETDLDEYIGTL